MIASGQAPFAVDADQCLQLLAVASGAADEAPKVGLADAPRLASACVAKIESRIQL
jgi:hypothetical protein